MIRFRLSELIADAQFRSGRRVTLLEISEATGINRMTLSRMTNVRGYSTSTDTIEKLCRFFKCDVGAVAQYVDDPATEAVAEVPTAMGNNSESEPSASTKARQRKAA